MKKVDIVFIGGGPAGYEGSIRAGQLGKRVLLVERDEVGGVCLNKGCIPTKSLISSAKVANLSRRAEEFGVTASFSGINFGLIQERKETVVFNNRNGIKKLLDKWGVSVFNGSGVLRGNDSVEVITENGAELFKTGGVVISTGSSSMDVPGIDVNNIDIFNSDTIHEIKVLPESLLIIGGGVIGCEYGYIFNSLGVDVTIVEMVSNLLPFEDHEISSVVERELKKKRVKVCKGRKVEKCTKSNGGYTVELSDGKAVTVKNILVSTGRKPNSFDIGLESIGVEPDKNGGIPVNNMMETGVENIYAAGDVTGKYSLAYVASHEGIASVENFAGKDHKVNYKTVPSVVFMDPEVGRVGLTEKEAKESGIDIRVGKFLFRNLGRSHTSGELAGMAKVICDSETDKIIGVHVVGSYASEIIHTGVMALKHEVTASEWGDTFFAHPVFSEAIQEACWDIHERSIHK